MSAALRIVSAGPGCTVQDGGRVGYLRFGVTGAGPMDRLAHATANLALGNAPGAAAIEISTGGIEVAADGAPLAVALAGGVFDIATDGMKLPAAVRLDLAPGQT
ncbi:MAG: urea amidolyase, partial [Alphaproteobacteria bacterium]|nr:urea amidolyase [Alphaproteobacteria bacterium]